MWARGLRNKPKTGSGGQEADPRSAANSASFGVDDNAQIARRTYMSHWKFGPIIAMYVRAITPEKGTDAHQGAAL